VWCVKSADDVRVWRWHGSVWRVRVCLFLAPGEGEPGRGGAGADGDWGRGGGGGGGGKRAKIK
jgi:hypothetical protein